LKPENKKFLDELQAHADEEYRKLEKMEEFGNN
jgi:hypothetical protein